MTRKILFKTLIDILFFLFCIGILGTVLILPSGKLMIDNHPFPLAYDNTAFSIWAILGFKLFTALIFLRGIYFLRKIARLLFKKNYFSEKVISHLSYSGKHFIIAGICFLLLPVIISLLHIFQGKLELSYNTKHFFPLFLLIIGIFFIIQSKALHLAKGYKEENDLTV